MATLSKLDALGKLSRYDPDLDHDEQCVRRIYFFPRAVTWFGNCLPVLGSTWQIEQTPLEQVVAALADFCLGRPLAVGHRFKALNHLGAGIWELKTADVRIFGWFAAKDCFVATDADLKRNVVSRQMYRPYAEQAVRLREGLDLDEPKFISGEDPLNVVSDFYFP